MASDEHQETRKREFLFLSNWSSFLWILVSHSGATSASSPEHERVFSSTGELVLRTVGHDGRTSLDSSRWRRAERWLGKERPP